MKQGNCYVTCEALYHLIKDGPLKLTPMTIRHEGAVHWYLRFTLPNGDQLFLDPTGKQFKTPVPLAEGRGRGFLTKRPSKAAREMMKRMVWK